MIYFVELDDQAKIDLDSNTKAGNKILLNKIYRFFEELERHPTTGTGKPHKLKHDKAEIWSRSIDERHRMLYTIDDNVVTVFVISLWGHYGDK